MLLNEIDFSYVFDPITDKLKKSHVIVTNHRDKKEPVSVHIAWNDKDFLLHRGLTVSAKIADLIDLGAIISVVDRLTERHQEQSCHIFIKLPMRQPSVFQQMDIYEQIQQLLYWYTGDLWSFEFLPTVSYGRLTETVNHMFPSSNMGKPTEVALWSGGLDAFLGLLNRIKQNPMQKFLLFSDRTNPPIGGVQRSVFNSLRRINADTNLIQVSTSKEVGQKNFLKLDKKLRARGLGFLLLGSAYALLEGQTQLAVYENGVGAINLPFRPSEVGVDHSRSVHPTSLKYVGLFISSIFNINFVVHNPFLWQTKAEMCQILREMNLNDIAWLTISCDRPHRGLKQCGCCSSCLLRRQSFLASEIPDETFYLSDTASDHIRDKLLKTSYLPHMQYQVQALTKVLEYENAWSQLAQKHPTLLADMMFRLNSESSSNPELLSSNILNLFQRYVSEWKLPNVYSVFNTEIEMIKQVHRRNYTATPHPLTPSPTRREGEKRGRKSLAPCGRGI